ncbi:acyltransferase family protein [Brachybacterium saurashtrense]|uniref:Acyltransferase n=1 Tax=Brachybacterium saurashtrense TaxID=556288 RepID=A0A345YS38_9MICO|nr:acyltransferase [Brachybacterium saurashtrense]AXK46740.1 acyltransferase [Brachybacterium saurashtrense]RRR22455.1 acyltransferase [Brachybacterium saurashtrense]
MTSTRPSRAEQIDAATPTSRNRVVDFLRAAAITVVVLGHWTIIAVDPDGGILPHGVLDGAEWTHPLTWIFQVMPIFFLVGGYSNGLSWRSARRKEIGYGQWLRTRLRRLGIPLVPLLLAWLVIWVVAVLAGAPTETVQLASQMALIPTWFLAAYLVVILVAPPCLALWERFGWWSVVGGVALAGAVDAVSIAADQPLLGYPNYLLVWAAFHQVGYAWLDGRLAGTRKRLLLAGVGAAGLLLLVTAGPYPVSMITAGGDEISNSSPTRVTMAFLGMLQAGLVLSLEKPLEALLRRPRLWLVTVLVNQRIMTWFLWHLTVMVGLAHLLLALDARALLPEPLTGPWWATRPLWVLALLALTGLVVLVMGRFESPRADERPAPPVWKPLAAAVCVIAGLAVMASVGVAGEGGVTWWWPLLPVVGLWGFGVARALKAWP